MKTRLLLGTLAFACASAAQAAVIQLDFTANLAWGNAFVHPSLAQNFVRAATTVGNATSSFAATGYFKFNTSAPQVIGQGTNYWSSESFKEVSLTFGGKTFQWVNSPEVTNQFFGLSLFNSPSGDDRVTTGNSALPTRGAIFADGVFGLRNGLVSNELDAPGGNKMFMNRIMFDILAPGLLTSDILAAQSFDWGSINFGNATDKALYLQLSGLVGTSELISQDVNGAFTSFSLHRDDDTGVAPVPEPGTIALLAAGLVGLGAFARRRPGHGG